MNMCSAGCVQVQGTRPSHPTPPTPPTHEYKWCVRPGCVQVQGTWSSHPTPPTPPTHEYKGCVRLGCVQVQGTWSSHPTPPTPPTHEYKWCVRLGCVQVQGTWSSHPTPPTPPTHEYKGCVRLGCVQVQGTWSSHPTPPTPPTHEYKWCVRLGCVQVQGTWSSHPTPPTPPTQAKRFQFLVASDRRLWSQVTACIFGFCWPCQRKSLFVVVSDRTLWSQVTQIPFFCLWSQVTGFYGRKWPPCRPQYLEDNWLSVVKRRNAPVNFVVYALSGWRRFFFSNQDNCRKLMSLLGIHYYIPTRIATCIPPSCIINQTMCDASSIRSCETVDFTGPCVMWWICWRTIWMICFWWLFSRHIWIQKTTPCRWFMTSVMAVYGI